MNKNQLNVFIIGIMPFICMFLTLVFSEAFFVCGLEAQTISLLLAIFGTGFLAYFLAKTAQINIIPVFLQIICLGAISLMLSQYLYDASYDGQWYHQEAIYTIAHGWNPILEKVSDAEIGEAETTMYLNHYSKGFWIPAAAIYKMTGCMNMAKSWHFLLLFGTIYLSYYALTFIPSLGKITILIIALIIGFNPTSYVQCASFYADGVLSSLYITISALAFSIIHLPPKHRLYKFHWLVLGVCIILAVNIKLISVIYIFAIALIIGTYFLYQKNFKSLKTACLSFTLSGLLGICVIGGFTYIGNTITKGHPLYPLNDKVYMEGFMYHSIGDLLRPYNRFERLWYCFFMRPSSLNDNRLRQRTLPFGLDIPEGIRYFHNVTPLVGGFGLWFGEALICSLLILFVCMILDWRKALIALAIQIVLIPTIFYSELTNVLRYIPYVFLLPLIPVILATYYPQKIVKVLQYLAILIFIGNIVMVIYWHEGFNIANHKEVTHFLERQKADTSHIPITISRQYRFRMAWQARFEDNDIPYIIKDNINCQIPNPPDLQDQPLNMCREKEDNVSP